MFLYQLVTSNNELLMMLLFICAYISSLLLAMSIHEFAHAHAALKEGDTTAKSVGRYTLAPFSHVDVSGIIFLILFGFGWAKPVPVDPRNFKNGKKSAIRVYSAGILANLGVGILSAFIYCLIMNFVPQDFMMTAYGMAIESFLAYMVHINFIFAFFNILPFYSFDGYRIIDTFLKPYSPFSQFMKKYSSIILIIAILTGIISMYVTYVPLQLAELVIKGFNEVFKLFI